MSNAIQLLQEKRVVNYLKKIISKFGHKNKNSTKKSQQAREMQRGFNRPTSINDLKAQVKPKLKSSKLERPKVSIFVRKNILRLSYDYKS